MTVIPIILNILKITGIVLASVIGLILFILILVLFVPIRYKGRFERTGIEGDAPVNASGVASWLFHVIHVSNVYPPRDGVIVTVRVFGFIVAQFPVDEEKKRLAEEKKKAKEEKKRAKEERKQGKSDQSVDVDIHPDWDEINDYSIPENPVDHIVEEGEDQEPEPVLDSSEEETPVTTLTEEPENSIFSRISDFINNIKYTWEDFCAKIEEIADSASDNISEKKWSAEDKIHDIEDNIHYYHDIIESDLFKRTFAKWKKRIIRLLKSILPRKLDITAELGFEDPYTTGEILAIAGILYPMISKHLHIYGNFDEAVIRGHGYMKGRIYVISLVKIGILYLTNKDLKRLIQMFKKEYSEKSKDKKDHRKEN